ncbi:hypothetical protein [Nocardioides convexus]|uniref:hypothetical protein n=1 Tax=Nocardioides convexus TaxID=2712224 RepID=UPI002418A469|nr:hypothetical protein [Nocardioides convexus]
MDEPRRLTWWRAVPRASARPPGRPGRWRGCASRSARRSSSSTRSACVECTGKGERPWSAYRPGEDNGFMAAMDRWIFHLRERHPGSDAPCLEFLSAAEHRLQERREQRGSQRT